MRKRERRIFVDSRRSLVVLAEVVFGEVFNGLHVCAIDIDPVIGSEVPGNMGSGLLLFDRDVHLKITPS